ncbi:hypothetical protein SISNIDRAFT_527952 [Sistotremastrum niveocremeum HHB9708]|uniref:Uncharacterized protein n=1 Tax=Sistotremastrum niveocremeum HHB9708 TaxID=1314777 RepID=A0A164PXI6_9AGAM|nr:hypothetical protein SISNIDRAFT_527952 [Sistotremastrum niveocremeum HHB9708]
MVHNMYARRHDVHPPHTRAYNSESTVREVYPTWSPASNCYGPTNPTATGPKGPPKPKPKPKRSIFHSGSPRHDICMRHERRKKRRHQEYTEVAIERVRGLKVMLSDRIEIDEVPLKQDLHPPKRIQDSSFKFECWGDVASVEIRNMAYDECQVSWQIDASFRRVSMQIMIAFSLRQKLDPTQRPS